MARREFRRERCGRYTRSTPTARQPGPGYRHQKWFPRLTRRQYESLLHSPSNAPWKKCVDRARMHNVARPVSAGVSRLCADRTNTSQNLIRNCHVPLPSIRSVSSLLPGVLSGTSFSRPKWAEQNLTNIVHHYIILEQRCRIRSDEFYAIPENLFCSRLQGVWQSDATIFHSNASVDTFIVEYCKKRKGRWLQKY